MGDKKNRKHKKCCKHYKKRPNDENAKVHLLPFSQKQEEQDISARSSVNVPDSIWALGAPLSWVSKNTGGGVIVGIIDTGVDDTHPVLKGKVLGRRDYVKDGRKSTFYNPHGTHVAGTICADTTLKGVAPDAKIRDYRVLDVNGSGSFLNVTAAVRAAADDGCHIINMSLGASTPYSPLQTAIRYAVSKGVLVVCAAGNEGAGRLSYPGAYPEVVSVGAVQFDSLTGNLSLPQTPWFSNTNPQVDLCADGWQVNSCVPGNRYARYSGTSMATPHIVGLAALLRNRLVNKLKRAPTENELYTTLRSYTVEVSNFNTSLQGTGFATLFPEIPKKIGNLWVIPSLQNDSP
jgi:major intracellular serine protease